MAAVTIRTDFGGQENKICHCFHLFPFCVTWNDELGAMIWVLFCFVLFSCWLSSQLFHVPLLPSSRGFLAPLHFLPLKWYHLHAWGCWNLSQPCFPRHPQLLAILIPAWDSSSLAFCMMYSTWKLNKPGDNIQPYYTPFPILNQSIVPRPVASWPICRFLRRQIG